MFKDGVVGNSLKKHPSRYVFCLDSAIVVVRCGGGYVYDHGCLGPGEVWVAVPPILTYLNTTKQSLLLDNFVFLICLYNKCTLIITNSTMCY